MQKPEWTKIGTVEVCIGTDGVTGVYDGRSVCAHGIDGVVVVRFFDDGQYSAKAGFEARYCQPPKPRHIIRDYADGSCVVESVEKDEQGSPLRCAMVRRGFPVSWVANWCREWEEGSDKQDAIARAVRYVETGE